jgi:isoaspartyl peptidase/L-asparaginase-like protein (Ntn-hydrolase superfamily)
MEDSPHNLLAGAGADTFAEERGFEKEELLAPAAREKWEAWVADGRPPHAGHDTVCSLALDASGELAGAVSTSGLCWKFPGRVGDSPLPGHGLYVYPGRGAAAATGDGELVQGCCCSFAAVEAMAAGVSPLDALMAQMESLRDAYDLSAKAQVAMIAIAPDGRFATAALRSGFESALAHEGGFEVSAAQAVLFEG